LPTMSHDLKGLVSAGKVRGFIKGEEVMKWGPRRYVLCPYKFFQMMPGNFGAF